MDSIDNLQSSDLDQIIQLLDTLYNSKNQDEQSEANKRLMELQASDKIWHFCWPLLDPANSKSQEVQFFAANCLVQKINQSWSQQNEVWLENHLRPKLFETLVKYASSANPSRLVIERLSLALATFALHAIPKFWPDAIEDILTTFTPQNLRVNISPQCICDILLKILMYIPEEYAALMPQQEHRAKLNAQITASGPIVFRILHSLLATDSQTVSNDCKQSVLKCITSWTMHSQTSLLEIDDGHLILNQLYEFILDDELCSPACSAIGATFTSRKADNFTCTVIDHIPKIAQLKPIIDKYTREDEIECVIKIFSLVINFAENHSRLLLKIVLNDGVQIDAGRLELVKAGVFSIIKIILDCSAIPGIYGVDEKYSDLPFNFWFPFFENFCYYSDSFTDLICKTFDPLVDTLIQTLTMKCRYPSLSAYYQDWTDDQRESYRCYRQDVSDNISVIVQFPRSRDRILGSLCDQFEKELANLSDEENGWQGFESLVFALKSMSEVIPYDEMKYMPKIFNLLSKVPFKESHALLYCTVAEMISAHSDWLYNNNTHLATAFNILFLGVNTPNSHVRLMSTLSLKDIATECQAVLHPYATQIVKSCSDAVLQPDSGLNTSEKSRLMHTIGTALAISPMDTMISSLSGLSTPLLNELSIKAQSDPNHDQTCRTIILDRLSMFNSLIESLYVKQYSGNEYELDGDENDCRVFNPARFESIDGATVVQPSIELLRQLVPILAVISSQYKADEEIMSIISSTIKRSAKSLCVDIKPVLGDLIAIIVNSYDPLANSNILEGLQPLYMIFRCDQSAQELLGDAFARISEETLKICMVSSLRQLSVTIENYFRFANSVIKKFHDFLTNNSTKINVEFIYKLAVASLELPEKRTLVEACSFLSTYKHKSFGVDHLHSIFVNHLELLLNNIFNIYGGCYSTPRNAIECVSDLFFLAIDPTEAKPILKTIVERENFPTSFVNKDQKSRFVSRIIHEKNRKKFKEICSEFVLQARNLNRVL